MKFIYLKYLWNYLRREIQFEYVKDNPSQMIKALQAKGVDIAADVSIADPRSLKIDLTRPSLIRIGHKVRLNVNLEILTHDFATVVMREMFHDFIPSSGKVTIGNNVYIGRNVTLLKGTHIGDNCIIGFGSIVTGVIPSNSVAIGAPAKVICTIEEFYEKRKNKCVEEAFEYARSIQERFHRLPVPADFWEEFPLFVSGHEIEQYPEIPIRKQLGVAYDDWSKNHKAIYSDFHQFLETAGVRID